MNKINKIREAVGTIFSTPMQTMSFPAFFAYLNEGGKITARSLMDMMAVTLTYCEEQEKKIEEYDANFKNIEEILEKLVDKKTATVIVANDAPLETFESSITTSGPGVTTITLEEAPIPQPITEIAGFNCPVCNKELKTKLALSGHSRSHK